MYLPPVTGLLKYHTLWLIQISGCPTVPAPTRLGITKVKHCSIKQEQCKRMSPYAED
jgi:hypothetical protein